MSSDEEVLPNTAVKAPKEVRFEPKPMATDDQLNEKVEHQFGFSEVDLETYGANIEQRQEKAHSHFVTADVATDIKQMDNKNLESMNLFGLPQDLYNREAGRSGIDLQNAVTDLV